MERGEGRGKDRDHVLLACCLRVSCRDDKGDDCLQAHTHILYILCIYTHIILLLTSTRTVGVADAMNQSFLSSTFKNKMKYRGGVADAMSQSFFFFMFKNKMKI